MKKICFAISAMILVSFLTIVPASAQDRSNTRGFYIGLHLNGSSWTLTDLDVDAESGGGLGLQLGYGFTRVFTLYLNIDAASIDSNDESYTLSHFDLGGRFSFRGDDKAFRPYLNAALSRQVADFDTPFGSVEITGNGLMIGGGFQYYFSRNFSMDVNLLLGAHNLSEVKFGSNTADLDENTSSSRFNIGVRWYPNL
jgi:hypothetical protein